MEVRASVLMREKDNYKGTADWTSEHMYSLGIVMKGFKYEGPYICVYTFSE